MKPFARSASRRWPDRLCARLPSWPRRHRLQAQGLKLSLRPLPRLAQDEEPGGSGGEARRGRRLGQNRAEMTPQRDYVVAARSRKLQRPNMQHAHAGTIDQTLIATLIATLAPSNIVRAACRYSFALAQLAARTMLAPVLAMHGSSAAP